MAPPKPTSKKQLPERETLGWLAQSAVPPKKQRLIEGAQDGSLPVGLGVTPITRRWSQ